MDLIIFLQIILFFFFLTNICFRFYSFFRKPNKNGVKHSPLVGVLPEFLRNRHCQLNWTTRLLAGHPTNTVTMHMPGGSHFIITADPLNVEHILKKNFNNYPKGQAITSYFSDFLGSGIYNSDGDQWKAQGKPATSEFSSKSLHSHVMASIIDEIQTRLVPKLDLASKKGQDLDLQDILQRFAFDKICKIAFNVDRECLSEKETTVGDL